MTTAALTHISSFDPLTQEQRMQRAWRTINGNGWRQRLAPLSVTFTSAVEEPNLGSAMRAAMRKERARPTDRAGEASGARGTAEGGSLTPSPDSKAQRNTDGSRHILRIGIRPCTMTIHYITDG
jgi:hypothetical protein